jgi:hypothetical protein
LFFKHLCYTLGARFVRQPNETAAAELRAEYFRAVLEIRLVSAQKPSLPFINMEKVVKLLIRKCRHGDGISSHRSSSPLGKLFDSFFAPIFKGAAASMGTSQRPARRRGN